MSKVFLVILFLVTVALFIGLCVNYPYIFAEFVAFICIAIVLRSLWLLGE